MSRGRQNRSGGAIVSLRGLKKSFTQGGEQIAVLRGVDLDIEPGEIVALLGPSGSGKSTLLQAVGLLEGGFEGQIALAGEQAETLPSDGRTRLRREHLGFVYQFHHLLPDFDARENVVMPQMIAGTPHHDAVLRADSLLASLGLRERLTHRPSQLSGGEQQRVAVARALANRPTLVLADEPTGNLDEVTADTVLGQFLELVRGEGSAALVATHNERLAARMDRVVRLHDGVLTQATDPLPGSRVGKRKEELPMSDHPSTFGGDTSAHTGSHAWDDRAALHAANDRDGILDGAKALRRGTFAELIRHLAMLPEEKRSTYVIEKLGDREYSAQEALALADHPDFPKHDNS